MFVVGRAFVKFAFPSNGYHIVNLSATVQNNYNFPYELYVIFERVSTVPFMPKENYSEVELGNLVV